MTTQTSIEEIIKKIPALKIYEANPDIVRQLYEELNPRRDLSEVGQGDYINGADVLVVRVLGTNSYTGCPVCFTKVKGDIEEGVSFSCPNTARCNGDQRVASKLTKWTLLAGDPTTKVILDFPPFAFKIDDGASYIGKVVNVKGKVTEIREEKVSGVVKGKTPVIMVRDMKVVSDIRAPATEVPIDKVEEAAPIMKGTVTTQNVFNAPPPIPAAPTIAPEKLKALDLWFKFQSGPVTEAQVVSYVTNNLKLTMDEVLPFMNKSWSDSAKATIYTLKTPATTTH